MKAIWKIPLDVKDKQAVMLPFGSVVLSIGLQAGEPKLWALVDPLATQREQREVRLFSTGESMPDDPGRFVCTLMFHDGSYVLHAFIGEPARG